MFATIMQSFKAFGPDGIMVLILDETFGLDRKSCRSSMNFVGRLQSFRDLLEDGRMPQLPYILIECIQAQATKDRDMLYALQNLDDDYQQVLAPDYDKPLYDVFRETTEHSMQKLNNFALLGMAGLANRQPQPGLPSWVPDFSTLPRLYPLDDAHCKYAAGGHRNAQVSVSSSSLSIKVKVLLLDHINVGDQNSPFEASHEWSAAEIEGFSQSPPSQFFYWPHSFMAVVLGHFRALRYETYINGTPLEEALWRTSIGDNDEFSFPAHESILLAFRLCAGIYRMHIGSNDEADDPDLDALSDQEIRFNVQRLGQLLIRRGQGRKLAVTRQGYLVLAPDRAAEGDVVCILQGAKVPYVLRKRRDAFELVGEAYVHGVMNCEALKHMREDDLTSTTLI
jgi:hypothetical protein